MKVLLKSEAFQAELPGWTLRGVLCAATSGFWAGLTDFRSAPEIAGMVAGLAFWVALFAWVGARFRQRHSRFADFLGLAAWIKAGTTAAGWLVFAAASDAGFHNLSQMAMVGLVDVGLGLAAMVVVAWLCGLGDPSRIAALDSFGWTALVTVIEGALMALAIAGLALGLWTGWRLLGAGGWRRVFSPVRGASPEWSGPRAGALSKSGAGPDGCT